MEKIEPLLDYNKLEQLITGSEVVFRGQKWMVFSMATLATGEPGVVLQGNGQQFVVGFTQLTNGQLPDGL